MTDLQNGATLASSQIQDLDIPSATVLHEVDSEIQDNTDSQSMSESVQSDLADNHRSVSISMTAHSFMESNSEQNDDSSAPLSSRGSTKNTGEDDSISFRGGAGNGRQINQLTYYFGTDAQEEEKEADGSPVLTRRFLLELFKKEWRRYYRTPELNEKLFLHYKGFSFIKNMHIFTQLKCLYFEGNGTRSLKGLEHNTQLRSLFIQENIIETIEGLETLKELRQLNLNDNMIKFIGDGL
jgi:Leucine-rich repeat (LRR) protein